MRKNTLNFIVDAVTLLAILGMTGTGLILKFSLPPGSGGRGLTLWGLGRHDFGTVHFWIAAALGALLIVHLVLHWSWVVGTIRRLANRRGRSTTAAVNASCAAFVIAIVGAFAGFTLYTNASVSVSAPAAREQAGARGPAGVGSGADRAGRLRRRGAAGVPLDVAAERVDGADEVAAGEVRARGRPVGDAAVAGGG
jgi:hypothetical protein